MTMIVMFIGGALLLLVSSILRFEPNAKVLTHYGDNTPSKKNRWAAGYLLALATLSFLGGAITLANPGFASGIFAAWLAAVFVTGIYVASK